MSGVGQGLGGRARVIRLVVERSGLGETTRTSGIGREQTKSKLRISGMGVMTVNERLET
jgi:hypothetical protein